MRARDYHELTPYSEASQNYESVDADEAASEVVANLEDTDFVDSFSSYKALLESCFA